MVAVDDARKIREKKSAVEGSSLSTVYQTTRYPSTNLQSVTLALEAESTWIVVASPGQAVCPNHQHTMDLRISTSDLSSTYSASVLFTDADYYVLKYIDEHEHQFPGLCTFTARRIALCLRKTRHLIFYYNSGWCEPIFHIIRLFDITQGLSQSCRNCSFKFWFHVCGRGHWSCFLDCISFVELRNAYICLSDGQYFFLHNHNRKSS